MSSPCEEAFEEAVISNGFVPTISIPTHQMPHCAKTCIDNIHTNNLNKDLVSGVIREKLSHHHPIFTITELPHQHPTPKVKQNKITTHYDYSNSNLDRFCEEIGKEIDSFSGSCETFESFLAFFQNKIDETCKLETPKTSKRNNIVNPWITRGLINSVEKKARLYFAWRQSCTLANPDDNSNLHLAYANFKNHLKIVIKAAKFTHYSKKFESCSNNSKKTWQVINELRGKTKAQVKDDFTIDGSKVLCRRTIASKFNEYFTSLASNLNMKLLSNGDVMVIPIPSFTLYMAKSVRDSVFLRDTDANEILEIIQGFQNGKASDIPIVLVKRSAHLIANILSKLYNRCLSIGHYPSIFKIGKVTPIYKKGNKSLIENYRPVSILPIFGKIFEKVIYSRLHSFFSSKGILQDSQFGFRKGHSTTHALHKSVSEIAHSVTHGKHVLGIFIDLSKAFDTLDHRILLHKLENYGVRGTAFNLLKSYLSDRLQCVSFLDAQSETLQVQYGVPQGSILGPLLFLIYINDIVNCYQDGDQCSFVLYADDTNIFVTGPSKESTFIKANDVLEQVVKYMKSNLLHINMSKCCFMHFKPKRLESDETCARVRAYTLGNSKSNTLFVDGNPITRVSETKFLGVVMDDELSWAPHINYLVKKLRSTIGALCRIRKNIPTSLYRTIYSALFESHLSYGITAWGGTLKNRPDEKLFITQKHCVRILFGNLEAYLNKFATCARARPFESQKLGSSFYMKEHTKPLFNRCKILTVQNIYKLQCINEVFKIVKFRCPYTLYQSFNISSRDTSLNIILPHQSNKFLYNAAKYWNCIHKRVLRDTCYLDTTTVNIIKTRSKQIILNCQALDNQESWTFNNFQILPQSIYSNLPEINSTEIPSGFSEIRIS